MLMSNHVICVEWIDSSEYDDASWKSEQEVKELTHLSIHVAWELFILRVW